MLMVRGGALGDVILTVPAMVAAGIDTIVAGSAASFLADTGLVSRAFRMDDPRLVSLFGTLDDAAWRLLGAPDRAIVFSGRVAPQLIARGCQAACHDPTPAEGVHQAVHFLRAVGVADVDDPQTIPPPIAIPQSWRADAARWRVNPGAALLLPGSGGLRKCWPASCFRKLGLALVALGQQVVVALGPAELDRGPFPAAFQGLRVLEGPSLTDLASLAAEASVVIGNDAGTTHLAAAVGASRVVALFGPTDPRRWRPLGPAVQVIHRPQLSDLSVDELVELLH